MIEQQTGGWKVGHFLDNSTAAPFQAFGTVILVLADSFPPMKDPAPSAWLDKDSLRSLKLPKALASGRLGSGVTERCPQKLAFRSFTGLSDEETS